MPLLTSSFFDHETCLVDRWRHLANVTAVAYISSTMATAQHGTATNTTFSCVVQNVFVAPPRESFCINTVIKDYLVWVSATSTPKNRPFLTPPLPLHTHGVLWADPPPRTYFFGRPPPGPPGIPVLKVKNSPPLSEKFPKIPVFSLLRNRPITYDSATVEANFTVTGGQWWLLWLVWLMLYGDWRLGEAQLQLRLSARVHDYREKKTLTVSLIYTRDHAMPCVSNSQTAVTFSIFLFTISCSNSCNTRLY